MQRNRMYRPGCSRGTAIRIEQEKGPSHRPSLKSGVHSNGASDCCPECGQRMQPEGRCFTCPACGFSKCGA